MKRKDLPSVRLGNREGVPNPTHSKRPFVLHERVVEAYLDADE